MRVVAGVVAGVVAAVKLVVAAAVKLAVAAAAANCRAALVSAWSWHRTVRFSLSGAQP